MPVGTNVRIAPVAGEASTAAPAESGSLADLFDQIFSCLAAPAVELAEQGASIDLPEQPQAAVAPEPKLEAPQSPLEAIQQLLALVGDVVPGSKSQDGASAPVAAPAQDVPSEEAAPPPVATTLPIIVQVLTAVPVGGGGAPVPAATAKSEPSSPDPVQQDLATPSVPPVIQHAGQRFEKLPQAATSVAAQISANIAEAPKPAARPSAKAIVEAASAQIDKQKSALDVAIRAMLANSAVAHLPTGGARKGQGQTGVHIAAIEPTAAAPEAFVRIAPTLFMADAPVVPQSEPALGELAPQADTPEFALERQLDLAHEGEWLDQLARDITETAAGDGKSLRFRLNPETLGSLRVEISQDRQGAAIRLTADTEAARAVIADAQPRLLAEARAQGLRISEAHVDLGGQNGSGDPRRQAGDFEEAPLRTARSLQKEAEGDGKPTPRRSERYA